MKLLLVCVALALAQGSKIPRGDAKDPRITGGVLATQGQFPYVVSIQIETAFGQEHVCGGTIINDNHVMTSAHCIIDHGSNTIHAVAGEQDLLVTSEYEEDRVGRHIEDGGYAELTHANDIALLRLTSNFVFISGLIEPVPLPANFESADPDASCISIGWGSGSSLMYGDFSPMTDDDCRAYHGSDAILIEFLCAFGPSGQVANTGDDGGPLMCDGKQFGIISWSLDDPTMPVVNTEVSHYIEWLEINSNS